MSIKDRDKKKKLEEMSLEELWELFPIILSPQDACWKEWAVYEISHLQAVLKDMNVAIYHIGSTAIKDIWAKPIIDLLLEIEEREDFSDIKSELLSAGYICMAESNDRMSFNKGYTPNGFAEKVFHLHLRRKGDNDEIYFRNYMNRHSDIAKEYEQLKLSLWKRFEHDRDGYTNAKSEFVKFYTDKAKSEASKFQ